MNEQFKRDDVRFIDVSSLYKPLTYDRLYALLGSDERLIELARQLGYECIPIPDADEEMK